MRWAEALAGTVACVTRALVLSIALTTLTVAQDSPAVLAQGRDIVEMPSMGRVVVVFLLVAGLAVGAVYALHRYSPSSARRFIEQGSVRVLQRAVLNPGLRVHLVQADGQRILIAESSAGLSMLQLRGTAPDSVESESS